jgi:hypothetical protein
MFPDERRNRFRTRVYQARCQWLVLDTSQRADRLAKWKNSFKSERFDVFPRIEAAGRRPLGAREMDEISATEAVRGKTAPAPADGRLGLVSGSARDPAANTHPLVPEDDSSALDAGRVVRRLRIETLRQPHDRLPRRCSAFAAGRTGSEVDRGSRSGTAQALHDRAVKGREDGSPAQVSAGRKNEERAR